MDEEPQIPYMDEFADYLTDIEGLAKRTIKRQLPFPWEEITKFNEWYNERQNYNYRAYGR